MTRTLRFTLPFPMLAYPFYLVSSLICILDSPTSSFMCFDCNIYLFGFYQWNRSPGKTGSHFNPSSDLFVPVEKKDVITSTICWTAMFALLVGLNFVVGPMQMLKLYGIPYWVFYVSLIIFPLYHRKSHWIEFLIWEKRNKKKKKKFLIWDFDSNFR